MASRHFFRSARPVAPPVDPGPLMTVAEAAVYLKLSPGSVYWHIAKNGLPTRRFGRAIRIAKGEADAWSAKHQSPERPTLVMVKGL